MVLFVPRPCGAMSKNLALALHAHLQLGNRCGSLQRLPNSPFTIAKPVRILEGNGSERQAAGVWLFQHKGIV